MAKDIISVLEEGLEKIGSFNMMVQMTREDVSEYERGKVAGRIEAFQWALRELANNETDTSK